MTDTKEQLKAESEDCKFSLGIEANPPTFKWAEFSLKKG